MIIMDKRQDKNAEDPLVLAWDRYCAWGSGKSVKKRHEPWKNKNKSGSCDDPHLESKAQIDF